MKFWGLIVFGVSLSSAEAELRPSVFEAKCSEVLAEKVIQQGTVIAPDRLTREELCKGFQNFQQAEFLAAAIDKNSEGFRTAVLNAKQLKERFQAEVAILSLKTTNVAVATGIGMGIQTQTQADQFAAMLKFGVPPYEARMIVRKTPVCDNLKLPLQSMRDQLYPLAKVGSEDQKKVLRGILATLNDLVSPAPSGTTASDAKAAP